MPNTQLQQNTSENEHPKRTAFRYDERIEKLPFEQIDRDILCIIYDIYQTEMDEKSKSVKLADVQKTWARNNPGVEIGKFKMSVEKLSRWRLISWGGTTDWADLNNVTITISTDGFYAGIGNVRKSDADQIIHVADSLIEIMDNLWREHRLSSYLESEVLQIYSKKYGELPQNRYQEGLRWLISKDMVRIEKPGQDRGTWLIRDGNFSEPLITTERPSSEQTNFSNVIQPEINFGQDSERIFELLWKQKIFHEKEVELIKQIRNQIDFLLKQVKDDNDSELQKDTVQLLAKVTGVDTLFDAIYILNEGLAP